MSEWRPIETAILNTEARLVWCPEQRNIHLAYWGPYYFGYNSDPVDGWMIFGGHNVSLTENPTHWQPLPEPPDA